MGIPKNYFHLNSLWFWNHLGILELLNCLKKLLNCLKKTVLKKITWSEKSSHLFSYQVVMCIPLSCRTAGCRHMHFLDDLRCSWNSHFFLPAILRLRNWWVGQTLLDYCSNCSCDCMATSLTTLYTIHNFSISFIHIFEPVLKQFTLAWPNHFMF